MASDPSLLRRVRDGSTWRIGTDAEVAWIADGTSKGRTITAAIPPVFDACATVMLPASDEEQDRHDRAVVAPLSGESASQPWWLGFLDTGADDVVFPGAPMVTLYSGWHYVLVEVGPEEAATWRRYGSWSFTHGTLPNLMFPPIARGWLLPCGTDSCATLISRPGRWHSAKTPHHPVTSRCDGALGRGRHEPSADLSASGLPRRMRASCSARPS
ncbi:MAG: hypothetical protein ABJB47_02415 [Actinomycetota bacterium]